MVLDYLSSFSLQTSTSATIRAEVPTEGPVNGCTYEISVCQLYLCMCCMRLLLSPSLALPLCPSMNHTQLVVFAMRFWSTHMISMCI